MMPPHPTCIQVPKSSLALPLIDARILHDDGREAEMSSLAINVEVLLGNKQKYKCITECRDAIRQIIETAKLQRERLEEQLAKNLNRSRPTTMEEWDAFMLDVVKWLARLMRVAKQELHGTKTILKRLSDCPSFLYAIHPPEGALPLFYPALYPTTTEPANMATFREIMQQFCEWKRHRIQNQEIIKAVTEPGAQLEEATFQEIFEKWDKQ